MIDRETMRRFIAAKRDGATLTASDWAAIVATDTAGALDEAQLAALLMAVVHRGLDVHETVALTQAMVASGDVLTYRCGPIVDKHSTGGVADTVSLLAVPLAAAAGVRVAKLAGRALGHTGGTIDKLEALPGVRTNLSSAEIVDQVERIGCAIAAQSEQLVPADRRLYALRDRTATVPSIGLIAASVVSKKIAAGADAIVYDVKVGRGAFLADLDQARALAERIVTVTTHLGRRSIAVLTSMDEPLGSMIGDGLEALEALALLDRRGARSGRLLDVAIRLAQEMVDLLGGGNRVESALQRGAAAEMLRRMLAAQGGRLDTFEALRPAQPEVSVVAERAGFVAALDPVLLGEAARTLVHRAGSFAGIEICAPVGTRVELGQRILRCFGSDVLDPTIAAAVRLSETAPLLRSVILERIAGG